MPDEADHVGIRGFGGTKTSALIRLYGRRIFSLPGILILLGFLFALLIGVLLLLPGALIHGPVSPDNERLLKAQNDLRATLLQAFGAIFFLATAVLTWRQVLTGRKQLEVNVEQLRINQEHIQATILASRQQIKISEDSLITERFARAIDHLGDDKLDARLGGIYALDRIARNSEIDRGMINEILMAFVQSHSPWPPKDVRSQDGQPSVDILVPSSLPPLRRRSPDIQAVLSLLGRRELPDGRPMSIELTDVDLRRADLIAARLIGANLSNSHLEASVLFNTALKGAILRETHLDEADLTGAQLQVLTSHPLG